MIEANYFLASSEGYHLEDPRACVIVRCLKGPSGFDWASVKIDPPLQKEFYGLGEGTLDEILVGPRHVGASVVDVKEWPVFVFVAVSSIPMHERDNVDVRDLRVIAWAELYCTREDAVKKKVF